MKFSRYNYIIPRDGMVYWFNGISRAYFCLKRSLSDKIQNISNINDIQTLLPNLYKRLLDNHFIIDDNENEYEVIKQRYEALTAAKDYFLIILPTLNCNYCCWYCVQDHIPTQMSSGTIENIKSHIKYMIEIEQIRSMTIEWFGGEPFMYYNEVVCPICEYAMKICAEYNIPYMNSATTNGFYLTNDIHKSIIEHQFRSFQITIDGTQEEHDKVKFDKNCTSTFERVLKNINDLLYLSNDINIILRINYTKDTLSLAIVDDVNAFIDPDNRAKIEIMPKKVWQEKSDQHRTPLLNALKEKFHEHGYRKSRATFNTYGMPCYANKKYYNAINYNGFVVKCTANNDLYSKVPIGMLLPTGEIRWKDGFEQQYYKTRFDNIQCSKCKNLPICMGKCPRDYASESNDIYCIAQKDDESFEDAIVNYIQTEERA